MEYARVSLPDTPPGGLATGIDWASADHAVCVVDAAGEVVSRFSVEHTAEGLRTLVQRLAGWGWPRSRSSAATGQWWTRCWRRA
jgi:transposase